MNKNGEIFNHILDLIENKDKMPKFEDEFKQKLFNEEIKFWGLQSLTEKSKISVH